MERARGPPRTSAISKWSCQCIRSRRRARCTRARRAGTRAPCPAARRRRPWQGPSQRDSRIGQGHVERIRPCPSGSRRPLLPLHRPGLALPRAAAGASIGHRRIQPCPSPAGDPPPWPSRTCSARSRWGPSRSPTGSSTCPRTSAPSHADGEVSERDIHHHGNIAKGGTGFVIVGATTPGHEDRPPDGDLPRGRRRQLRPGPRPPRRVDAPLRREVRGPAPAPGAPVRDPALQHAGRDGPGPQAAVVRGPRDRVRERRGEGQGDPRGVDRRDPRARRPVLRGRLAGQAGRLRRRRAARRPRLPPVGVHEPVPQHAHRPLRRLVREPDAVPARGHRLDPEEVRQGLPDPRPLLVRGVVPGRPRHRGGPRDRARPGAGRRRGARPLAGHAGEPGRRLRPDAVPAGLGDLRRRGDQEGREDPGHHLALAARPGLLRADPRRGQDGPRRPRPPAPRGPVLAGQGEVRQGQVDPPLHLLPRRLLAGVADGQARDRVLHQRGLRPAGLRRHDADREARAGRGRRRRARPAWRRRGSPPSAATW